MQKDREDRKNFPILSIRILLYIIYLFPALIIQSCYSSVAVKGTPVEELALTRDEVTTRKADREAEKEAVYVLSRLKENKVFVEIAGIPEYRIGPLDVLEISSHVGNKVTATTVTVDNRGRISYSFIDDLEVAGLAPSQLDGMLTKEIANYIKNPRIDILVKEFKSKSVLILGELASLRTTHISQARSGKIYLKGKTTLMDLIALAGGYTVDADIKNVKLMKRGKTYRINLYDIIEKGDERLNVIVDDGDVIDVPELPEYGERVYVMGEVNSQGVYSLKDAQDLLAAIALAGSFTSLAKEENTLIVRAYEPGKSPLVMMADLKALLRKADLRQNIPLEDGDLVYVPRMRIGDINEWIANTKPLLDLLLYPAEFEEKYFLRRFLHFDRRK
ncbi:MAG: polysaccharide export protein [Deltaproteobacteria bacterium]|nr:polysaccharide export protein [Deltaproteobacteria bacterium]MBW1737546.1 polysaccharide export protein [Deltaproteobacteria bacterium]MBW1908162.1 polysaccharide export protein [Deltaproteobacteria bacterium]MBW2032845.1 polysaccharide export protein [Deltaproteobacteria bacterium]MBW2114865.1 polysaccharide export protein [Deltaproteobacteria bacterium]